MSEYTLFVGSKTFKIPIFITADSYQILTNGPGRYLVFFVDNKAIFKTVTECCVELHVFKKNYHHVIEF